MTVKVEFTTSQGIIILLECAQIYLLFFLTVSAASTIATTNKMRNSAITIPKIAERALIVEKLESSVKAEKCRLAKKGNSP